MHCAWSGPALCIDLTGCICTNPFMTMCALAADWAETLATADLVRPVICSPHMGCCTDRGTWWTTAPTSAPPSM